MQPERFEVVVIGSGFAGKWVAWEMAAAGHRTAAIERRYIGGSCPNINSPRPGYAGSAGINCHRRTAARSGAG
jgi:glycine/D-amino acid oxidase-like deaminating enzyme